MGPCGVLPVLLLLLVFSVWPSPNVLLEAPLSYSPSPGYPKAFIPFP